MSNNNLGSLLRASWLVSTLTVSFLQPRWFLLQIANLETNVDFDLYRCTSCATVLEFAKNQQKSEFRRIGQEVQATFVDKSYFFYLAIYQWTHSKKMCCSSILTKSAVLERQS